MEGGPTVGKASPDLEPDDTAVSKNAEGKALATTNAVSMSKESTG